MLRAIVLGIVQGITEFLPISSSAHLSIVPRLLGYATPTLAFEILLHFGTLAAVVAYFARDLWAFVLCLVAPGRLGPEEAATRRRLLGLLALASVPAAVTRTGFVPTAAKRSRAAISAAEPGGPTATGLRSASATSWWRGTASARRTTPRRRPPPT